MYRELTSPREMAELDRIHTNRELSRRAQDLCGLLGTANESMPRASHERAGAAGASRVLQDLRR